MKGTPSTNGEKIRETWLLRGRLTRGVLIFAAILAVVFLMWVVFVYTKSSADQRVFEILAPHITETRTRIMLYITHLGNHQFLIPFNLALIGFFLLIRKNWLALRVAVIALGGLGIKLLMKNLLHRVRPLDPVIEGGVAGFSFPSGHALMSVACYGFLVWWAAISIRNKWSQGLVIALILILMLAISFTRIYLRVHYITDILAGICVGFTWLVFALWQIDRLEIRQMAYRKKELDTGREGV